MGDSLVPRVGGILSADIAGADGDFAYAVVEDRVGVRLALVPG